MSFIDHMEQEFIGAHLFLSHTVLVACIRNARLDGLAAKTERDGNAILPVKDGQSLGCLVLVGKEAGWVLRKKKGSGWSRVSVLRDAGGVERE